MGRNIVSDEGETACQGVNNACVAIFVLGTWPLAATWETKARKRERERDGASGEHEKKQTGRTFISQRQ